MNVHADILTERMATRSRHPGLPPRRMLLRFRLQIAMLACDLVAVALAVLIAGALWRGSWQDPAVLQIAGALCPLYLAIGLYDGAFAADALTRPRRGLARALRTLLLSCILLATIIFFLKTSSSVSRAMVVLGSGISALTLVALRTTFYGVIRNRYGTELNSVVLICDELACEAPPGAFAIDASAVGLRCDLRDPMMLDRLGRLLANADRVVVSCPPSRRRDWAMMLKGANIRGEILNHELTELGPLGTDRIAGRSTVVVAAGSLELRQRITKRLLDLAICGAALLALAPVLALVALAVRLDSAGPVLFVQQRVGRGNRLFRMYKFRSMRAEACDGKGHRSTARGDDRITRVGAIIRATSLDELPQLLNVLKGDMSIVGPRPHALGSLAGEMLFWEVDERYWHRHACKPGLTGLAQVRGFRGATHQQSDLVNRLQADLEYVDGWTVWRDLAILASTLRVVVHKNAY